MSYQHCYADGSSARLPVGKVVCIGRNYADHAKELNNPIPAEPLLFMKPATSIVPMAEPFALPKGLGEVHFETEMALLIGERLCKVDEATALAGINGVGLALDLTLRDIQSQLKSQGQPWEKAKGFDGACPLSVFVPVADIGDLQQLQIRLTVNGELRQDGNTSMMLNPVASLLSYISQFFTLEPGDVVLTGTPAGVGPVRPGDKLWVELDRCLRVETAAC